MAAVSTVLLVGVAGVAGALSVRLFASSRPWTSLVGAFLVVAAGSLPLGLAYGFAPGVLGLVAGGAAAAVWRGRSATWPRRGVLALAVVLLAIEPLLLLTGFQIRADETYSRCAADKAVAVVEASRRAGQGSPASMHDVAMQDGSYGDAACYVSNGVNWLYRVDAGGGYTLGYWVDWRVTRRVCVNRGGSGWTCGFEAWGPFRAGETD